MQFGPYLLLERISVGGMAEVYKAKEYGVEGFERTVAVKRILPHVAEDEEFIAMFKDEAKIAVQLNHGNIAQIYNLGNEQDSFYIALEYVNGRDLRAIFQKCQQQGRPMPVAQACYVIMKICEGLDYAHNKKDKYQRELNIVHRDVSPPNILTSFEGEVKLIDFGVAKAAGRASRTQAGILKGKFGYMSPEQVRGMPLDRRSDVFSVGVVLFEMLTGHRLFQADTDFATLEKVRAVEVPRPGSLNPEIAKPLENIIYKALAREPEQRYQSSIELHDELQAFMFAQGLFYSRKDLSAWMRQQYAREIELEKEKDKVQAAIRPDSVPPQPRRQRKTVMMPPGAGPPPPPPGGGRKTQPPPPPGPRTAPPRPPPQRAAGVPQRTSPPPGGGPPRPRKVKRKTMVMTTARPNLPAPSGTAPPTPRAGPGRPRPPSSQAREAMRGDPPTVPIAQALPKPASMPANPKPRPSATMSYAATSAPPASDFDWDDDELETRLFEGDDNQAVKPDSRPQTSAQHPQVGGAIAARPAAANDGATGRPASVSVTVVPGAVSVGGAAAMRPAHATVAPQGAPPPTHNPFPAAPAASAAAVHAPPHSPYPQHPGAVPHRAPPIGATQAVPPMMPHAAVDYDEGPARSSAGPIIGILIAVIVLLAAAFVGVVVFRDRLGGDSATGTVAAQDAEGAPSGETKTAAVQPQPTASSRGALTVQTTPPDATVSVDNAPIAGTSPFVVTDLQTGPHRVKIARAGYMTVERDVPVAEGAVNIQIPLEHQQVALVLDPDPRDAAMNLIANGTAVAQMGSGGTTYKLSRQAGIAYEVEAVKKGYSSQRVPLTFTGEATQKVSVSLAQALAAVPPTPAPPPAAVPSTTRRPSPGRGAGRRPPKRRIDSRPSGGGSTKPPPVKKEKTSVLRIGTNPGVAPASVFVDGKYVGKTPIASVKVTPGRHTVKFKWPNGREVKQSVNVADGASKMVKAG